MCGTVGGTENQEILQSHASFQKCGILLHALFGERVDCAVFHAGEQPVYHHICGGGFLRGIDGGLQALDAADELIRVSIARPDGFLTALAHTAEMDHQSVHLTEIIQPEYGIVDGIIIAYAAQHGARYFPASTTRRMFSCTGMAFKAL